MSVLTATHHTLNFNSLSFDKFEELCFWLVDETGEYELVEHFGGGGDKNRDVVGYTPDHELDYFQCKRYDSLSYSILKDELDSILAHVGADEIKRPRRIYFVLSSSVSPEAKDKVKEYAKSIGLPEPAFWEPVVLDKKVKRDAEAKRNFFNISDEKNVEILPQLNMTGLIAYSTDGYTFQIINQGDTPAVDCRWSVKGFAWPGYFGGLTAFYLTPGQKMDLRIAMPGDFMKQKPIRELRLHFEYSDSKNNKFCSERELIPENVNSGAFYRIGAEAGEFFPAKPLIRFTINSVEPLPRTGLVNLRYATFFYKGKEAHLKIGISGTVGAIWQFNLDEIEGAFRELVDKKISKMVQNGEYEGELVIISDSLPADKAGFESYQKFRDEIK